MSAGWADGVFRPAIHAALKGGLAVHRWCADAGETHYRVSHAASGYHLPGCEFDEEADALRVAERILARFDPTTVDGPDHPLKPALKRAVEQALSEMEALDG